MTDAKEVEPGVYLKKGKFGYSLFYPYKKDLNKPFSKGNINWRNVFGLNNKKSWMMTIFVLVIVLGSVWAYKNDTAECFKVLRDPCDYCIEPFTPSIPGMQNISLNITNNEND